MSTITPTSDATASPSSFQSNSAVVERRTHRTPHEVLAQVFELAILRDVWKDWDDCEGGQILTLFDTPVPFMLVYKHWYDVCTSHTALWTTFVAPIVKSKNTLEDVSRLPAIFKQYLRWSKQAPLSIKLALSMNRKFCNGTYEITRDVLSEADTIGTRMMATLVKMAFNTSERCGIISFCTWGHPMAWSATTPLTCIYD